MKKFITPQLIPVIFATLLLVVQYVSANTQGGVQQWGSDFDLINSKLMDRTLDTIVLENREYRLTQSVVIDRPVVFQGGGSTKLKFIGTDYSGIVIKADRVVVQDLAIVSNAEEIGLPKNIHFKRNPNPDYQRKKYPLRVNSGIYATGVSGISVKNNKLIDWVGNGVFFKGVENSNIVDNFFSTPFYLTYSNDIHIKGSKSRWSQNIEISGNRLHSNNRVGISVGNAGYVRNVAVLSNVIDSLGFVNSLLRNHGILAYYGASNTDENNGVLIAENRVSGTVSVGIYVAGGAEVVVRENYITDTGLRDGVKIRGILVQNSLKDLLIENNVVENYRGSFPDRCAISSAGKNKNTFSRVRIRKNRISRSSGGVCINDHIGQYEIVDNHLSRLDGVGISVIKKSAKQSAGAYSLLVSNNVLDEPSREFQPVKIDINPDLEGTLEIN